MLGAAESFKACKFISEDAIEVNLDDKKTRTIYQFCRNMTQNYIDTYLAVAVALQAVQEAQMTLENRKLTARIHICIQELVQKGIFKHHNSCLMEVIDNALARFA